MCTNRFWGVDHVFASLFSRSRPATGLTSSPRASVCVCVWVCVCVCVCVDHSDLDIFDQSFWFLLPHIPGGCPYKSTDKQISRRGEQRLLFIPSVARRDSRTPVIIIFMSV